MDRQRKRSRNAVVRDAWEEHRISRSRSRGHSWSEAPSRSRSPSRSHSSTRSRSRSRSRSPRHRKSRKSSKRHRKHKRLSPEADSSSRGEYGNSSRRKKYKTQPTVTSATQSLRHPASDEDEDEAIRRDMEHHARHVWRHWCDGGRFSDGHSVTLEKVIEFIDTEVLPKEEDILRQRIERTIAPVSGIESRILPVLQLWRKQELQNYDKQQTLHHSQFKGPLASISTTQEPHVPAPQLGPAITGMSRASTADQTLDPLSASVSTKCKANTIPATIILDSDDEKDAIGEQDHPAHTTVHDRETISADLEFLRSSLAKAQEISKMIASLCGDLEAKASMGSEQLPASIFLRLQSAQQQARNMGLETIFCEPLLLKVLEEHMKIVHDLNVKVARNDIIIVSKGTGSSTGSHVRESTRESPRMSAESPNMHPKGKDDLVLPSTEHQDDITTDNGNMEWETDVGSAEAVPRPNSLSTAESVLAALDDGPDDIPEMELFNKASEEEGKTEDHGESTFKYEMVRGDKSIRQIWEQWTVGVDGNPPIRKLEEQYGARWRMAKDTNYLNQTRCIVREIARLITDESLSEDQAIQLLQDQLGSRAIGTFALQLFKENAHRRKGKPKVPRRTTTSVRKEKSLSSCSETPPPPEAPPLPEAQTPTEIWEELVRNSRLMDMKFFTPSPSAIKRHKSSAIKTSTKTKEASEAPTPSPANPATNAHSANLLPTTTVAATIPAGMTPEAFGTDATPSLPLTSSKDPIVQMPTPTPTPASGTTSEESPSTRPALSQPSTPGAPSLAHRTYKTAVEEALRGVNAVTNATLVLTSPTMNSNRPHTRELGMVQTTSANTAPNPATTIQTLEKTPAATVQAPSQPSTQVVHPIHPRTRASTQAQATSSRHPSTTTKPTAVPSNNALALVYANALLTRFMASSKTQDPGPSSKGANGDHSATTVTTVTAATAAMTLVSSVGLDLSRTSNTNTMAASPASVLTTSTSASVLTPAPVTAPVSTPVPVIAAAQVPVRASTGASVALAVRTRSSSRKASNGAFVQTSETSSNSSMSPVNTSATVIPSAAPTTTPAIGPAAGLTAGEATVSSSSRSQYHMNKNNKTVYDVWTEWMEGIDGSPSISSLNRRYGDLSWLLAEERELYRDQRMVLVEAEKLVRLRGMQVKQALDELEQKRVSLSVDIKVFGKVLAENKAA